MLSLEPIVNVPLLFSCTADHVVPNWQPRVFLGMVRTRSVYVKKPNTHTHSAGIFNMPHFIPIIVGVGKRGAYLLVYRDVPRQHPLGTTLRFTGPVPANSRQ